MPSLEEIIVTARRESESLQRVPMTVDVVTPATIQSLNMLNFQDIAEAVPGLTLTGSNTGYEASASLRGVNYSVDTSASPTVATYLNDTPTGLTDIFESLYDIKQIQVLEGPQGTIRGESAPSGAITVTTQTPDLNNLGGYVEATGTQLGNFNGNGAINLPLIAGKLALRLAGVANYSNFDGVKSAFDPTDPYSHTQSERATLEFQPNDQFTAVVMYQHLYQTSGTYNQVVGPGYPGATIAGGNPLLGGPATLPANYNGPPISAGERLSVDDGMHTFTQDLDEVTWNASYHAGGQTVSYIGSFLNGPIFAKDPTDTADYFPGYDYYQGVVASTHSQWSHELRLVSQWTDHLNSTLGMYYTKLDTDSGDVAPASFLSIPPFLPTVLPNNPVGYDPNTATTFGLPSLLYTGVSAKDDTTEANPYAGLDFHTGGTDISASGRLINSTVHEDLGIVLQNLPGPPIFDGGENDTKHAWIYNASVSQQLTDDIMAYFTTGTAWRRASGLTNSIVIENGDDDPYLTSLLFPKPETSTSYEVGLKSAWFDRRLVVDVSGFHQTFTNMIISGLPVQYLSVVVPGSAGNVATLSDYSLSANSTINGLELDAATKVTSRWSISGDFSYAKGNLRDARIPCSPPAPVTPASFAPGTHVDLCPSEMSTSQAPDWNLALQSEYDFPVGDRMDSYFRAHANVYGHNPYADTVYVTPSYGLLDLYVGLRDPGAGWEFMLFAKNVTGKTLALLETRSTYEDSGGSPGETLYGPSGYYVVSSMTPQREFGLNVRYDWQVSKQ